MNHQEIASRHLEEVVSEMGPGTQAILLYGAPENPGSENLQFVAIGQTNNHMVSLLMLQHAMNNVAKVYAESN